MIPSTSNHFGLLIVALSFGAIYFILKIFQIENYDWIYAIPICILILYSLINNDNNSESDKSSPPIKNFYDSQANYC